MRVIANAISRVVADCDKIFIMGESHANYDGKTTVGEYLQLNLFYFGKFEKYRLNFMG